MRIEFFLQVIFHLFFLYSVVNSSYIGFATSAEIVKNSQERVWVNTVGTLNSGVPYLHLFDSHDAKMLVTMDSPTYNFSQYFDNEWAMTDKEVIRYGKNGISFKSKGVMKPVYMAKWSNTFNHASAIYGTEQEIRLWGYFSSVCLPGMVPVCIDAVTKLFYVPSLTRNFQLECHDYNTRFGDQEVPDYTSKYCNFLPADKWAGFTYYGANEKFAALDVEVIEVTEYSEPPKVIKKLQNLGTNPVSYNFQNSIVENNQRIDKTTWSHAWDVKITAEKETGSLFAKSSMKIEVGYQGSYANEVETQTSVTTTNNEHLAVTLNPNTSLVIKQTSSFERQKIRAQICYPPKTVMKPWFGSNKMIVGHSTTKELYLQQTGVGWPTASGVAHVVSGQLCFLGEFNLETNVYASLILDK
jgi:hypothetical protein